jgi:hypothetical protein
LFAKIEDDVIQKQLDRLAAIRAEKEAEAKAELAKQVTPQKEECTFEDFEKMDIRTATVLEAERVPKTDKLLKLTIDTGIDDIRSSESVESQPAFDIRNSRISGLKSGSEVAVYSLDGKVLMRSHADSDGNASLNLQSATSGIYIIKTPTRTIKITK